MQSHTIQVYKLSEFVCFSEYSNAWLIGSVRNQIAPDDWWRLDDCVQADLILPAKYIAERMIDSGATFSDFIRILHSLPDGALISVYG